VIRDAVLYGIPGLLYFVDNATYKGKLYWNIFDIVREIKQCNYKQALQYIALFMLMVLVSL